ncbi:HEPN domain-containing protein [Chloroflexota bacterium]
MPLKKGNAGYHRQTRTLNGQSYLRSREAGFLSQQVTEKALKAFLYAQGEEIVLGHSVARLCANSAEYNVDFSEKAKRWSLLEGYYIPTRYPNGLPDGIPAEVFTEEAAKSAVALADEAVNYAKELI